MLRPDSSCPATRPIRSPVISLPSQRLAGLDTLRALAILWVAAHHYALFVSGEPTFGWFGNVGWVGVDLFFVLSGYLIGHQLLAGSTQGRAISLRGFWTRRWLRTLPAFWLVLAAYWLWPSEMGGRSPPALWRFLSFTQNIWLTPGTAFSHAWSLCVEEQFYLVLPLVLLVGQRMGLGRRWGWALLGACVAVGTSARAWLWTRHGLEAADIAHYHPAIYYATLCRFDELLPGLALAGLRHTQPTLWATLMRRGQAVFWTGTAAVAFMLWAVATHYYVDGVGYGFWMTAVGYSAVAWSFALLVLAALSPASPLHRWSIPGARTLALWSYAIYLSHKAVGHVLAAPLAPWGETVRLPVVALASLAVGGLIYTLVERPVMHWRDANAPGNFKRQAAVQGGTLPA
jgi:peptidoglycan/LPS O-acetylase OafA/YrhL